MLNFKNLKQTEKIVSVPLYRIVENYHTSDMSIKGNSPLKWSSLLLRNRDL